MSDSNLQHIGAIIKTLRKSAEITQTELAKEAGLTQAVISQFEDGKRIPSTRAIGKIAKALNVPLERLLSDNTTTNDPQKEAAINQLLDRIKDYPTEKILNLNRFIGD